ncbi:MAG TPA: hypothetical protein VK581_12850 [Chthoniobacterales bacterium]|nr:hypothetical protein [Chthoniobacterales bacterium]
MNPEKLFDYLEGNLPAAERARLEALLATDPQLQRELAIARAMHERARGSREVIGESEDLEIPSDAAGKLGRRVATAFAALVLLNVLFGILFIVGKKRGTTDQRAREAVLQAQVESSLKTVAERTMTPPTLGGDEIRLFAPTKEHASLADNVLLLATQCGGSAAKAPPDGDGTTVLAQIPAGREDEFRRAIAPLAQTDSSPPARSKEKEPAPDEKRNNIYVRITEAPRAPSR